MKKSYETPSIEVVKFQYRDQVVVASGQVVIHCGQTWYSAGSYADNCVLGEKVTDSDI